MARATITKRFELSPEAVAELERRVKQMNARSQTAYIEAWLGTGTTGIEPQRGLAGSFPPEMLVKSTAARAALVVQPASLHIDQARLDEIAQESADRVERNSLSPEATQERAKKKAALAASPALRSGEAQLTRMKRKAGLAASVGASLSGLAAESATDQAERMKREAPQTANASDLRELVMEARPERIPPVPSHSLSRDRVQPIPKPGKAK